MKTELTIPDFWEFFIKKYVKKTFFVGTRKENFADKPEFTEGDYRFFAKGIRELSTAFTQERSHLPQNYLNQKEYRSGYILYFLPVNALKVTTLLQRTRVFTPKKNLVLRFLDLGCGPGTALVGTFQALEETIVPHTETLELHWTLVDQNRLVLQDAQAFHEAFLGELRRKFPEKKITSNIHVISGNLFTQKISQIVPAQKYDLIFALNFLNEFPREKRLNLVDGLVRNYLHPEGKILLMEPALRLTSREIMKLHDELLTNNVIAVLSPCLHQSACPMLSDNNRDWCHTYIDWNIPNFISKLDHLAGIRKDYLKCSYLLLGHKPKSYSNQEWRVVSGQLNSKGKSERLLCGSGALPKLLRTTRLDKDATAQNRPFDYLERGDLVQMEQLARVKKETLIRKLHSFS